MSNRYRDASLSPEERTEDLLAQMTLDEKLAQLQCHFYAHGDLQKDTRYGIGQVSTLEFRQALSLEEAAGIQREIQETVMKNSRFGIPAVFHMEGLCGALVQDATSFPAGIGRGASFDPALEEKISEIVSRQERALGITQILAPRAGYQPGTAHGPGRRNLRRGFHAGSSHGQRLYPRHPEAG